MSDVSSSWPIDGPITLPEAQALIGAMFGAKDASRGADGTFMWFMEEVGELAAALREESRGEVALEFADVLAWLMTLANIAGVDLDEAMRLKYGRGCPRCGELVCGCGREMKP